MKIRYFQKGFNYSQDGPGNRLVYHLHGCNLHCPWCSNPEGMRYDTVYPAYPVTEVTVDALIDEILSCRPMFFDGGGVTFTGGEATLQIDALREALRQLHALGINTAIETNAQHRDLPTLFPFLDHLIMDLKSAIPSKLAETVGGVLPPILRNLEAAASSGQDTLVHIPLIHGFNDTEEDTDALIAALLPFRAAIRVELLSYHEYGKDKWKKCGLDYAMTDAFIGDEAYREIISKFRTAGLETVRT